MPSIGSIEHYDGVEPFKQYLQRVDFYLDANAIGADYQSQDSTKRTASLLQRKAVFLTLIGKKTYHLLNNLLDPKSTSEVEYLDIRSTLENYFIPTVLEVAESFRFHRCTQREGETIVAYVSRLREAASSCNYGGFLERALRDQFISGVSNIDTQRKLLEETRAFDKCIQLAVATEAASKEADRLKHPSSSVNFMKNKHKKKFIKSDGGGKYSNNQGFNQSVPSNAKLQCTYCKKEGHLIKKCFKRQRDEKQKNNYGDKKSI